MLCGSADVPVAVEARSWLKAEELEGAVQVAGYFAVRIARSARGGITFLGRSVLGLRAAARRWFRH